ncbi:MAG: SUMF1/EgtB/PvdO family nonheme iron enzyme [Bryobacteraceae bacterium]
MADTDGVCAIIPRDQKGLRPRVLGMGILVSEREVVTCAHVADKAKDFRGRIRLCFPFADGQPCAGGRIDEARYFRPGRTADGALGDVAVIVLDEDAPAPAVRLSSPSPGSRAKSYGFRAKETGSGEWKSHPDGEWASGVVTGPLPGGRVQFEGLRQTGARVEPGFSGGGVFDPVQDAVVGMVVESDREPERKMAQLISAASLGRALGFTLGRDPQPPSRAWELAYVQRLRDAVERKAKLYSPLEGIADVRPEAEPDRMLDPWEDDPTLAILSYQSRREEREKREFTDALEAFRRVNPAALLGKPGSGKSTTLLRLALDLASRAQEDGSAPIPLLVTLGSWSDARPLADFLDSQAPEISAGLETLNAAGRLALLLDGLNEMPTGLRAGKVEEIRLWIESLGPKARVAVSCREDDYTGELDLGFDTLTLQELKPWRVRDVLRRWVAGGGAGADVADGLFWQLAGDAGLAGVLKTWIAAGSTEESFWTVTDPQQDERAYKKTSGAEDALWRQHVPNPRSLLKLAANPFLLTMLFQVWRLNKGDLPRNRAEVFQRFVNALLAREGLMEGRAAKGDWRRTERGEKLVRGLTTLAWRMQTERVKAGPEESGDFGVLTVAARQEALEALGDDEDLLKKALDGTLLEGDEEVRFRHQLLQEYFTALAMREIMADEKAAKFWPAQKWWERSGWEEAAVLLAGLYSDDCSAVVRWLAAAQPELAVQCGLDSGASVPLAVLEECMARWRPSLTDIRREPAPEARAAIGRALGRAGLDDRKGVGVKDGLPDIDWVRIPGGEFIYQKGERRKEETFRMARYPVTNAQYEAFLNAADGYGDDRWWKGLSDPDRTPAVPGWSEPNHPRERVSWWEAMAFCGWLSHRLGYEVRLPSEWEWERAARGANGREYPWGNGYKTGCANINETWAHAKAGRHNLGRTSAVGIYPQGASHEGVLDLAGNVWEWCLNEFEKPRRTQRSGREPRVLRGGSWYGSRGYARAGYRFRDDPHYRDFDIGFRVVCSSPIR